jgi:aryl-alcohol dehydrogenase-like predicted oxidoreductase
MALARKAGWPALGPSKKENGGYCNEHFIGLQIEYSLIERTVERELIPMAKALHLGVLAFSPLAGGVLTGKYHDEGKADGGRMSNDQ